MDAEDQFKQGDVVRFTTGPLGVIADVGSSRFMADVDAGTTGEYAGRHPQIGGDGWHLVTVKAGMVPVHTSMIEKVES